MDCMYIAHQLPYTSMSLRESKEKQAGHPGSVERSGVAPCIPSLHPKEASHLFLPPNECTICIPAFKSNKPGDT